ncbi:glycosyltransferase family A protein [Bacillus licheniformis]|uniref:glycosyltransferase family A protein n=1 Tax=Bacillus licheniformis TaxID=1402 RepID=UPI003CF4AABA
MLAAARNAALSKAEGRYVAFLDSDDVWKAEKLDKQLRLHEKASACFLIYGIRADQPRRRTAS